MPEAAHGRNQRSATRFGRIYPPDEAWLAKAPTEPILDPDLPIIDTHHHLWHRPDHRYLLHELLADLHTGHNVVATVFLQCHAMYRASGPEEMRPVGETEFVAGIAAMSDSGGYGPTRVAAGHRRLRRPDAGRPGRGGAGGADPGRRRPVPRRAPFRQLGRRPDHRQRRAGTRTSIAAPISAPGLARLSALGLSLDAWVFFTRSWRM